MILALLLAACSPVRTLEGAPFDLAGDSMLFLTDAAADERSGLGVLLVTDEPIDCDDMPRAGFPDVFKERLNGEGRGLALFPGYTSLGEVDFGRRPWQGLYTTASGQDGDGRNSRIRSLLPRAYDRGFGFLIDTTTEGGSWFSLDAVEDDEVVGSFHTPWWTGRVRATICLEPGKGGPIDCSPETPDRFYDAFANAFCAEWDECSDDECPVDPSAEGQSCAAFDPVAVEDCLCGEWSCYAEFPGFAYPEPPVACAFVCGDLL